MERTTPEQIPTLLCPYGTPRQSRWIFSEGTVIHGQEPMQEQVLLRGTVAHGGLTLEHFLKDCSLWKGATLWQGKSVRRKEQQKEAIMDSSQPTTPCPPCAGQGWGQRSRERSSEVEMGNRVVRGMCYFIFCLWFSPYKSISNGNKLNQFSQSWACFACDSNW